MKLIKEMIRYVSSRWPGTHKSARREERQTRPGRRKELNDSSMLNHIVWWVLKISIICFDTRVKREGKTNKTVQSSREGFMVIGSFHFTTVRTPIWFKSSWSENTQHSISFILNSLSKSHEDTKLMMQKTHREINIKISEGEEKSPSFFCLSVCTTAKELI